MIDIQSVGHVCVDLTPSLPGAPVTTPGVLAEVGPMGIRLGGAVANTARAITALGRTAAAAVTVGQDLLGDVCASMLEQHLPGATVVQRSPDHATSYSVVVSPPQGDRTFWHHTGANDAFDGTCDLLGATYVHFGYPALAPGMTRDGGRPTVDLFRRAREQGSATSLDLAYCAENSPLRSYDWSSYFGNVLPHTDVFCPSWDDIISALRTYEDTADGVVAAADDFLQLGAGLVLITMGERGSYLATGTGKALEHLASVVGADASQWAGQRAWVPASTVEEVVSTNAAGDTFKAAFLLASTTCATPEEATRVAAHVVSRHIAGLPLLEQL